MLFKPTYRIRSVVYIDEEFIAVNNIKGMVLDLDNTLSDHGHPCPSEGVVEWLKQMKRLGVKLIIASNNTKRRVRPLAKLLKLNCICNSAKPLTFAFTIAHRRFKLEKSEIVVVGDQLFTDVLGANIKGMRSILVEPFHVESGIGFKFKRWLEKLILRDKNNKE